MTRALVLFAVLFAASLASADIAPPPGYVEQCTVEKQQKKGEECKSCSAWHGERDKCDKELGKDGYTSRCKTRGASAWTEVWCRPAKKDDKKPETDKKSSAKVELPAQSRTPWLGFALGSLVAFGAVFVTWRASKKS